MPNEVYAHLFDRRASPNRQTNQTPTEIAGVPVIVVTLAVPPQVNVA